MKQLSGIVTLFLVLLSFVLVQAQTSGFYNQGGAAQYYLGDKDQVLMPVNIWGFVTKPGQYMVPYGTDLVSLLSYAGGPREEAKIKSIKVVRGAGSTESGQKEQVIDVDVKNFLETGKSEIIPVLKPGDTVVVSGTTFHFVSRFFDFAWRIATLVQVWAFVQYYGGK